MKHAPECFCCNFFHRCDKIASQRNALDATSPVLARKLREIDRERKREREKEVERERE